MAAIAVKPLFMQNCTFTVDSDDFSAALSSVAFNPTTPSTTFTGLSAGAQFSFVGNATWQCALTLAQDYATAGSLANYLFENQGTEKAVSFVPNAGTDLTQPTIAATLLIAPAAIGGGVNAVATATVTLGVQGAPTITAASGS